jgi:hypothetical protein
VQNLECKRVLDQMRPGRFASLFTHYRTLLHPRPKEALHHFRKKKYIDNFAKKVYRLDEFAMTPLESVRRHQADFKMLSGAPAPPPFPSMVRMLKQYLLASLTDGGVYSLPCTESPELQIAPGMGHSVFQVIDMSAARYKFVQTMEATDARSLRIPVLVQQLYMIDSEAAGSASGGEHNVYSVGSPQIQDVYALTGGTSKSKRIADQLSQWQVKRRGAVPGCMCIHSPVLVKRSQWQTYQHTIENLKPKIHNLNPKP